MLSKLNVIGVVANESSGSSNEYYPYTREYEVVLQESGEIVSYPQHRMNV